MEALDHAGLIKMKLKHPDWIWNRSDTHVILGVPESPEGFKTVVEPGNSFSPGFRSYGVSTWVSVNGQLYAPEAADISDLDWSYLDGFVPVLMSKWRAGDLAVQSELLTTGVAATRDIRTELTVTVTNTASRAAQGALHLVIRSFGASGGPISQLGFAGRDVFVNGRVVMSVDTDPERAVAVSYDTDGVDVGQLLAGGVHAGQSRVTDPSTWASGSLDFVIRLEPGASTTVRATCFVHADDPLLTWLHREPGNQPEPIDRQAFVDSWKRRVPIQLSLPDQRYQDALMCQLAYLTMSTVCDEPRISPISYPLWWLRDGSYVLTALEKGGVADWVDTAIRGVAARQPFGGFGAEGDGPSQLIWLISEHYLMTRDPDFLSSSIDAVRRNADLLIAMSRSERPVFGQTQIRTPEMMFSPQADLMCAPAAIGLITGRMDLHYPRFWINGWAVFALRRAALCERALHNEGAADVYDRAAATLLEALEAAKAEEFGQDERDVTSALWPTGWASPDDQVVRQVFDQHWDTVRCPGGNYQREPEWTYFEVGQAHNYLLLGDRARAWQTIDSFLSNQVAQGLYTYHEGIGDENSSLQWQRTRGWDQIAHVTPHGWTAAELFLLLRDGLLRESGETLVIGSGVPESWLASDFSARGLPTHFGCVDLKFVAATRELRVTVGLPVTVLGDLADDVTVTVNVLP